jgi:hypothetical protein
VQAFRWCVLAAAFIFGAAFSSDSAGKACVKAKGERGVSYDVYKTKVKDAYAPGGRRMLQDGHRIYEIEVPALIKRDKPITCTMSLASGQWAAPTLGSVGAPPALGSIESGPPTIENRSFSPEENRQPGYSPFIAREKRVPD